MVTIPKKNIGRFANHGLASHVDFRSPCLLPHIAFRPLPGHSSKEDPTGVNTPDAEPWRYQRRRAIVIAALADTDEATVASRVSGAGWPAPAEIFELADELYEVRFDLGELAFPTRNRESSV